MLSTYTNSPVVSQSSVSADFLQAFEVFAKLLLESVGKDLRVLAGLVVLLTIKKPGGDLELLWVLDDGDEFLDLVWSKFTSALVLIDRGFFANHVREPPTHARDRGQGEHDLAPTIDVRVQNAENVLKVRADHERRRHRARRYSLFLMLASGQGFDEIKVHFFLGFSRLMRRERCVVVVCGLLQHKYGESKSPRAAAAAEAK